MANSVPVRGGGPDLTSLSVFLPMYNEEENIVEAVDTLVPVLERLTDDFEVVIIDDGSTDRSVELAMALADRDGRVRVVTHETNLGYGAALTSGYRSCEKDRVFYTDSDMPVDFVEIGRAWEIMNTQGVDAVVGYRLNPEKKLRRRFYTVAQHLLIRLLFGMKFRDVNFSFKMITRRVRDSLQLSGRTGFVEGQMLYQLAKKRFRVREVGVQYLLRQKGESSFDSPKAAVATLREMLTYWWLQFGRSR